MSAANPTRVADSTAVVLAASFACLLGTLPWYLGQYPGILTMDSIDQLWQASGSTPLNDYHSVAMTRALRLLGGEPRSYLALQTIVLSAILGVCFILASMGFDISRRPSALVAAIVSFFSGLLPPIGMFLCWLIKDVPFGAALLISASTWAICLKRSRFSPFATIFLGFASGLPWLFRHDGIFVFAFSIALGLTLAAKRGRAWLFQIAVGGFLLLAARAAILKGAVSTHSHWAYSVAFVQDISGILAKNGRLDETDKSFVLKFADPEALSRTFDYNTGGAPFLETTIANKEWLATHRSEFIRGYLRIVSRNISTFLNLRLGRLDRLICPHVVFAAPVDPVFYKFQPSPLAFGQSIHDVSDRSYSISVLRILFWCSTLPLLILGAIALYSLRQRRWELLVFVGIPLVNFAAFTVVTHSANFRYNFYLYPFAIASVLCLLTQSGSTAGLARLNIHL